MRTTVTAAPMPIAFCREVVVASVGQSTDRLHENRVIEDVTPDFSCSENFIVAFPSLTQSNYFAAVLTPSVTAAGSDGSAIALIIAAVMWSRGRPSAVDLQTR